jgi:hypothetical protein
MVKGRFLRLTPRNRLVDVEAFWLLWSADREGRLELPLFLFIRVAAGSP